MSLTLQDDFEEAAQRCSDIKYSYAMLEALTILQSDPFPYALPEETKRSGYGICRDMAICLANDLKLARPDCKVYVVVGERQGWGHAWVEAIDGSQIYWCDITQSTIAAAPSWFSDLQPTTWYEWDGRKFSGKEVMDG